MRTRKSSPNWPEQPKAFHVMVKPRGSICNLDCHYCFYLKKEKLYPGSNFWMSDHLLEEYTRQYINSQKVPEVTFAWQGGEPSLMGLEFFQKAVFYQQKYCQPGMRIHNAFQTNGTLLNEDWCQFFHENHFLIGLSIDGPHHLHDKYRQDKGGQPTFTKVIKAANLLKQHNVEFNTLTCVNAVNAQHGIEVYQFLRDEVFGIRPCFLQFIPIVERDNTTGFQYGQKLTDRSVTGYQYGNFLISIFDEWIRNDVGNVFVQIFDVALAAWVGQRPGLCIFEETCGLGLAMEFNGDLYSCDHFVEPCYSLGNITKMPLAELVNSPKQYKFGLAKKDNLPKYCRECEVKFICNGGCPKDRILTTPDGEQGLNHLCSGYRSFFNYIDRPMRLMAALLRSRRAPAEVMRMMKNDPPLSKTAVGSPCPCGSNRQVEHCHKSDSDYIPVTSNKIRKKQND